MNDNIQTNTTGRLTPYLQQKIDKTRYLVEVHFSATSIQSVEDKLKRVILHDLEHGKQGRPRKNQESTKKCTMDEKRQCLISWESGCNLVQKRISAEYGNKEE
nr:transposon-encoded TnpW family protein [uncultured Acetatifactor sp.]